MYLTDIIEYARRAARPSSPMNEGTISLKVEVCRDRHFSGCIITIVFNDYLGERSEAERQLDRCCIVI